MTNTSLAISVIALVVSVASLVYNIRSAGSHRRMQFEQLRQAIRLDLFEVNLQLVDAGRALLTTLEGELYPGSSRIRSRSATARDNRANPSPLETEAVDAISRKAEVAESIATLSSEMLNLRRRFDNLEIPSWIPIGRFHREYEQMKGDLAQVRVLAARVPQLVADQDIKDLAAVVRGLSVRLLGSRKNEAAA